MSVAQRWALHERPALWLILALGLGLRLATVILLDIAPESDAAHYESIARNLLAGQGATDGINQAFLSAGYALFVLAPAFWLTDGSLLGAQVANALLGAACIALCHAIAREAGASALGRLLAAGLFAVYVPSWVYAEYLAKENLMTPLMLLALWAGLRMRRTAQMGLVILAGACFGLLAIVGNAAMTIVPAVAIGWWLAPAPWQRKCAWALAGLLVAAAIATPWVLRNVHVLGKPLLNTNGGFNLYIGNNPAATGMFVSISETPGATLWHETRRDAGEVAASAALREQALQWMREHPAEVAQLALRKAVLFWTPPVHEGTGPGSPAETAARRIWLAQYLLMCGLALAGLARLVSAGPSHGGAWLLWLAVVGYTAVHMIFYVIFRYREPMMPVMAVLAALAVDMWLQRRPVSSDRPIGQAA